MGDGFLDAEPNLRMPPREDITAAILGDLGIYDAEHAEENFTEL